jgi:methoxymalonate biosynthesis acyl carrier protein
MTREEIKSRVRTYLGRFFRGYDLQDDEDMFALGFVNSLFAMQLVTYVESEFGVTIESDELDIDNFRTVNAIADLVIRKQSG